MLYILLMINSVEDVEWFCGLFDLIGKFCLMVIVINVGMLDGIRLFSVFNIVDIVKFLCCDVGIVL